MNFESAVIIFTLFVLSVLILAWISDHKHSWAEADDDEDDECDVKEQIAHLRLVALRRRSRQKRTDPVWRHKDTL